METTYRYRHFAAVVLTALLFFAAAFKSEAQTPLFWTGAQDHSWSNPDNWSYTSGGPAAGVIPDAITYALFDGNGAGNCILSTSAHVLGVYVTPAYSDTLFLTGHGQAFYSSYGFVQQGGYVFADDSILDFSGFLNIQDGTFHDGAINTIVEDSFSILGGTFEGSGLSMSLRGNTGFEGGTFVAPQNLFLYRDFRDNGGVFRHNGGTVYFGDTIAVEALSNFYNAVLLDSAYVTLTANLDLVVEQALSCGDYAKINSSYGNGPQILNADPGSLTVGYKSGVVGLRKPGAHANTVAWFVGSNVATYHLPFITEDGENVWVDYQVEVSGSDSSVALFWGTIVTDPVPVPNNLPYPPFGEAAFDTMNFNSLYAADRYWGGVQQFREDTSHVSVGKITLRYTQADLGGSNLLQESRLVPHYSDVNGWRVLRGVLDTMANTMTVDSITINSFYFGPSYFFLYDSTAPAFLAPPVPQLPQTACGTTSQTFSFDNIHVGSIGDQVEWSLDSSFSVSSSLTSPATISVTVESGKTDTIWMRSRHSATGETSASIFTTARVSRNPDAYITPKAATLIYGQSAQLIAHGGASYNWTLSGETTDTINVMPTTDTVQYEVVVSDNFGCTSKDTAIISVLMQFPSLSAVNYQDTIASGSTTVFSLYATVPGTDITWTRDNLDYVTGTSAGTDAYTKIQLTNTTGQDQTVTFTANGSVSGFSLSPVYVTVIVKSLLMPDSVLRVRMISPAMAKACNVNTFALIVQRDTNSTAPDSFLIKVGFNYHVTDFQLADTARFSATMIGDTAYITTKRPFVGIDTLYYSFVIPCSAIPDTTVPGSPQLTLKQTISVRGRTGITYGGNYTLNSNSNTIILSTVLQYPFIENYSPNGFTKYLSFHDRDTVNVQYKNSGKIDFDGAITVNDGYSCLSPVLNMDSFVITLGAHPPIAIYTEHGPITFPLKISHLHIPHDSIFAVKEYMYIDGCIPAGGCKANFDLNWGCDSLDICKTQYPLQKEIKILRSSAEATLAISRILPAGNPADPTGAAWDAACVNETTQWEYLIENTQQLGGMPINDVIVALNLSFGPDRYTYIIDSSVHFFEDTARFPNATPIASMGNQHFRPLIAADFGSHAPTECFTTLIGNGDTLLREFVDTIPILHPKQKVILRFQTYRCCARDNDFNRGIYFNLWNLPVTGFNECGYPVPVSAAGRQVASTGGNVQTYSAYVSGSAISSNQFDDIANRPNLMLTQTFEPTSTDIQGGANGGCGAVDTFNIINETFTSNDNSVSEYGTQLFCFTDISNFFGTDGSQPRGQFKVQFRFDAGLQFNPGAEPVIYHVNTWHPASWDPATGIAIFDIDDLPSGINDNGRHFRDFFIGSAIRFPVQGCCTTGHLDKPNGDVYTSFNPKMFGRSCDSCFIPLSKVHVELNLHCPGCKIPGIIIDNSTFSRSNFGYRDSYDHGLPDGPNLTPITASYGPLQNGQVNLTRSIVGDTIKSVTTAFFEDGYTSQNGTSYHDWLDYWDSAGWSGSHTMPRLTELYLQQNIPKAGLVGLTCLGAQLQYIPLGTGTPVVIPITSFSDTANVFLFHVSASDIGPLVNFEPLDRFVLTATYRVCKNPPHIINPHSSNATDTINPSDTVVRLTSDNEMFLTRLRHATWNPYQSYGQATVDTAIGGPGGINPVNDSSAIYFCETFGGIHYVYPIIKSFSASIADTLQCNRAASLDVSYYIQKPRANVFRYEYRMMPNITALSDSNGPTLTTGHPASFYFKVPYDYRGRVTSTYTSSHVYTTLLGAPVVHSSNTQAAGQTHPSILDTNIIINGPHSFISYVNRDSVYYSPPFAVLGFDTNPNYGNGYAIQKVKNGHALLLGDEYFRQVLNLEISPRCEVAQYNRDTIRASDIYAIIPNFAANAGCDAPSDDTLHVYKDSYLRLPQDTAIASIVDSNVIVGRYVNWRIKFIKNGVAISNMILFIEKRAADSLGIDSIRTNLLCNGTTLQDTVIYSTDTNGVVTDSFYRYTLGGEQPFCLGVKLRHCTNTVAIPLSYSWSCDGLPSNLPPANNLCSHPATIVLRDSLPNTLLSSVSGTVSGTLSTCDTLTLRACVHNPASGGVGNFLDSIKLPNSIRVLVNDVHIIADTDVVLNASDVHATVDTDSTVWVFDTRKLTAMNSTSSILGVDGLNVRHPDMCLTFKIIAKCNSEPLLPKVRFTAIKYCGDTVRVTDNFNLITLGNGCGPYANLSVVPCTGPVTYRPIAGPNSPSPLTIDWAGGLVPDTVATTPGTYTITVIDTFGCYETKTVTHNPLLQVTSSVVNATCKGGSDGQVAVTPSGGSGIYTYAWRPTSSTFSSSTNLAAGTYYTTVRDSRGCTAIDTNDVGTIDINLSLALNVYPAIRCYGGTTKLTVAAQPGYPPYTYLWSTGSTMPTINNVPAGAYSVTVTDLLGCKASVSVSPTSPAVLTVAFAHVAPSCHGNANGSISATAGGGAGSYTFLWSTGSTASTISGLHAGIYQLTVRDRNNCMSVFSDTLTEPDTLTLSAVASLPSCSNSNTGVAIANASGGTVPYTYQWSNGASSASISNIAAGSYSVTVADAHGCSAANTVTIASYPALSVTSNAVIDNCSTNDTVSISVGGGVPTYSYVWDNGSTSSVRSSLAAGTYNVVVAITDMAGCTLRDTIAINNPLPLTVTVHGTDPLCHGAASGTDTAYVTGGAGPYSYHWNARLIGTPTNVIANGGPGVYSITVTDANGCTATSTDTLVDPPLLSITTSVLHLPCGGTSTGIVASNGNGGTPPYTYLWDNSGTDSINYDLDAGTHSVTVTDAHGCTASTSSIIAQRPQIQLSVHGPSTDCDTGVVAYYVSTHQNLITYNWSVRGGSLSQASGDTIRFSWVSSGPFGVTVTAVDSVCHDSITQVLIVNRCCPSRGYYPSNQYTVADIKLSEVGYDAGNGYQKLPIVALTSGTGFSVTTNNFIQINGTFVIDTDLVITNAAAILMGENSKIVVKNNHQLSLGGGPFDSVYISGCKAIWQGIRLEPLASIETQNINSISDADTAIYAHAGGIIHLSHTMFMSNYKSVVIDSIAATTRYPLTLDSVVFGSWGALFQPRNVRHGCSVGVEVNNVMNLTIGNDSLGRNTFSSMDTAINIINSGAVVVNNSFDGTLTSLKGGIGHGVHMRDNGYAKPRRSPIGPGIPVGHPPLISATVTLPVLWPYNFPIILPSSPLPSGPITLSFIPGPSVRIGNSDPSRASNRFVNCDTAIWVNNFHNSPLEVVSDTIVNRDTIGCGVWVANCNVDQKKASILFRYAYIHNNSIANGTAGIYLSANGINGSIIDNTVDLSTSHALNRIGIMASNSTVQALFVGDTISGNTITKAYQGIVGFMRTPQVITGNSVTLTNTGYSGTAATVGIWQSGATGSYIGENSVRGIMANQHGLRLDNANTTTVQCNTFDSLSRGINANGPVTPTGGAPSVTLLSNRLMNSTVGIAIDNNGIIGPQGNDTTSNDNNWIGGAINDSMIKTYTGSLGVFSPFHVRKNGLPTNGTFIPITTQDPVSIPCPIYLDTAKNTASNCVVLPISPWTPWGPILPFPGTIHIIHFMLLNAIDYGPDSSTYRLWERYNLYTSLQYADTAILSDSTVRDFVNGYRGSITGQLIALQVQMDTLDLADTAVYDSLHLAINAVNTVNGFEDNLKSYTLLYLHTAFGGMNSELLSAANSIASQCVFTGGPAVLQARSLLMANNNALLSKDWDGDCYGTAKRDMLDKDSKETENPELDYRLVPNLYRDNFTASIQLGEKEVGKVLIFAMDGRIMGRHILSGGKNSLDLSSDGLGAGVYLYKVVVNGQVKTNDKLVVVH